MTSTFTTNLGLQEPATGDQANTWGNTLNTNQTIIDNAVAGNVSINLPGQAGYPTVSLSFVAGTSTQRLPNRKLVFTGTLTANTAVLWPSGKGGSYIIQNSTTGAFTVTLGNNNGSGGIAGATVVVSQGQTVEVFSDGTNMAQAVNAIAGALTVNGNESIGGTLSVTGNTTLSGNLSVSGSTSLSAINGTPIGQTTPAAGAFTTLSASGNTALTGPVTASSGTTILTSTASGATLAPLLELYHNEAAPAANDFAGLIQFQANNASATQTPYAEIFSQVDSVTAGAESGHLVLAPRQSGTLTGSVTIGSGNAGGGGVQLAVPTGGDKGFGTINAAASGGAYFQNGNSVAARAWVNFSVSGGVVTVNASHNVSSVTRNSLGDFTVNFTNGFASANYAASVVGTNVGTNNVWALGPSAAPTANAYRFTTSTINFVTSNVAVADPTLVSAAFFGN
jgi:hypothetical protein